MGKSIHGHYGNHFEDEAKRIQKLYKEVLNLEISWREATDLVGVRSMNNYLDSKKLKEALMKIRGLD